jgi:hypothetical protein
VSPELLRELTQYLIAEFRAASPSPLPARHVVERVIRELAERIEEDIIAATRP